MNEFTEYRTTDNSVRGGTWIARRLPETMAGECVVDHPDAGGPCSRPVVHEVYGLPFCGMHGLEAGAGALAQLHHDAMDDFARMDNPYETPLQSEVLRVVGEAHDRARDEHINYFGLQSRLVREAFPLIRERVDAETRDWNPGSLPEAPVDWWTAEYVSVCSLMLRACTGLSPGLARDLEPLRERAAAQSAFAEVVDREKIEAHKAAKEQ